MKVNGKMKFEVKCSFLKPLSQNLDVLTPCCDATNLKMCQKVPNWYFMYQC